jgi:5-(carboxyamino)imidazole ribonucleotide synthase
MLPKRRNNPLPYTPQKTIGILGSGQLGRMLVIAASQLGFRTHIFAPDANHSRPPFTPTSHNQPAW